VGFQFLSNRSKLKENLMDDREMSNVVEAALNSIVPEMGDYVDGDLLVDWVVVAYVTNPDEEKTSAYPMLYANGHMPTYRAIGLLRTGLRSLEVPFDE
jgi:hypothetical protein